MAPKLLKKTKEELKREAHNKSQAKYRKKNRDLLNQKSKEYRIKKALE